MKSQTSLYRQSYTCRDRGEGDRHAPGRVCKQWVRANADPRTPDPVHATPSTQHNNSTFIERDPISVYKKLYFDIAGRLSLNKNVIFFSIFGDTSVVMSSYNAKVTGTEAKTNTDTTKMTSVVQYQSIDHLEKLQGRSKTHRTMTHRA